MKNSKISPLSHPLDDELQTQMDKIFPPVLPSPNLYRIVAKNKALFMDLITTKFIGSTGIFDKKRIPPEMREKIILRTCVVTKNDYEFALHEETISRKMGISGEQITDIINAEPNSTLWKESDLALFRLIDTLVSGKDIEDKLFTWVSNYYSEEELIDIILIIGFYTTVGMLVSFAKPEKDNYAKFIKHG